ncbi:MAG: DUF1800 domain-containing protein [Limnohabitans sp.]
MNYWVDLLASRQVKEQAERSLANIALRKSRDNFADQTCRDLALNLVNSPTADRAWQTWFWFNHFNVFPQKSHVGAVLQSYVFGAIDGALDRRFADLLRAVTVHPAMLMYLDNVNNTKTRGNENLARELLELHTLGVSGGYSQQEVGAVAKVLSGWTVQLNGPVPEMGQTIFRASQHDSASHLVLGRNLPRGGAEQLTVLLDQLASHPSTARNIARKIALWWFDEPPEAAVKELVQVFDSTGGNLQALWQSARALHQRMGSAPVFKDPMHYVLSAVQTICGNAPVANPQPLLRWMRLLGQPLLARSTPDGYPLSGSAWLNPGQLAQRIELAREMVANAERLMTPAPISTDSPPERRPRFKLNDLRSTRWGQPWLRLNPHVGSMASGGDPQDASDLWALYLASPQFMYR